MVMTTCCYDSHMIMTTRRYDSPMVMTTCGYDSPVATGSPLSGSLSECPQSTTEAAPRGQVLHQCTASEGR